MNNVSNESNSISNEGFLGAAAGFILGWPAYLPGAGAAMGATANAVVQQKEKEIEKITDEIIALVKKDGQKAVDSGAIDQKYLDELKKLKKVDIVIGAIMGTLFPPFYLAVKGSQLQDKVKELKKLNKQLQDMKIASAISNESDDTHDATISNPDLDEKDKRVDAVEDVEALTKVKEEEIEELLCDIEDVKEVQAILGKVENVAKEALEEGNASPQLGEATHLLLKDLFGRAGIGDDNKLLPSAEMFANPKTVVPAMNIAVESISVVQGRINVSVETANKLLAVKRHELEVAQEAFMDSVKDFFVHNTTSNDVSAIASTSEFIGQRASLPLKKREKMEGGSVSYFYTANTPLNFFIKGNQVSDNISTDLLSDVKTIEKLTDALKEITSFVSKSKELSDLENTAFKNILGSLNKTDMLGGLSISVGNSSSGAKQKAKGLGTQKIRIGKALLVMSPIIFLPLGGSFFTGAVLGSIVGKIGHDLFSIGNRDKLDDAISNGAPNFSTAAKQYSTVLSNFSKTADEFLNGIQENKKSNHSEIRDAIRIGYGIVDIVLKHSKYAKAIFAKLS